MMKQDSGKWHGLIIYSIFLSLSFTSVVEKTLYPLCIIVSTISEILLLFFITIKDSDISFNPEYNRKRIQPDFFTFS